MFCTNCGNKIDDGAKFCPECGKKLVVTYKQVFERKGQNEETFIASINQWFKDNPKAANMKCKFEMDTAIGLMVNKYQMDKFTVEYELFTSENLNQYAIVKEEKMGLTKTTAKDYMAQWKESNPNWKVVTWEGGTHSRGSTTSHLLGGFGATNRMTVYIVYKFPRKEG